MHLLAKILYYISLDSLRHCKIFKSVVSCFISDTIKLLKTANMTSTWPLYLSSLPTHNTDDNLQLAREKSYNLQPCKVCGGPAYIIHYGAMTCNSCKTFFYRYGVRPEVCNTKYYYSIVSLIIFLVSNSYFHDVVIIDNVR